MAGNRARCKTADRIASAVHPTVAVLLMSVSVVRIWRVRMGMGKRPMLVPMGVRFAHRIFRPMFMLVVFVMEVRMHVRRSLMGMRVLVMLGKMEPNAKRHESASYE